MKDTKENNISDLEIQVTAKELADRNRSAAIVLVKMSQVLDKHEFLATRDVVTLVLEDEHKLHANITPRSVLYYLRSLEKSKLVESVKPIGRKRPTYWKLTESGKKVAEILSQKLGMQ